MALKELEVRPRYLRKYRATCSLALRALPGSGVTDPTAWGEPEVAAVFRGLAARSDGRGPVNPAFHAWRVRIVAAFAADSGNAKAARKLRALARSLPRSARPRVAWYEPDVVDLLEDYARARPEWWMMFHLEAYHGLRRASAAEVPLDGVHADLRAIEYPAKARGGPKWDVTPFCERCPEVLERYLREYREPIAARAGSGAASTLLLTRWGTAPSMTTMDNWTAAIEAASRRDGVEVRLRAHDLRRTFQDECELAQLDASGTRRLMSHESDRTTPIYRSQRVRLIQLQRSMAAVDEYRRTRRGTVS
jgi:hypothetical protein